MMLPFGRGKSGGKHLDGRHDKFLVAILNSKWQKAFKCNSQEGMWKYKSGNQGGEGHVNYFHKGEITEIIGAAEIRIA